MATERLTAFEWPDGLGAWGIEVHSDDAVLNGLVVGTASHDTPDANARRAQLFAAAPDLLTACRLAFALLNLRSDAPPEIMDTLASAVIKALGEEATHGAH